MSRDNISSIYKKKHRTAQKSCEENNVWAIFLTQKSLNQYDALHDLLKAVCLDCGAMKKRMRNSAPPRLLPTMANENAEPPFDHQTH